MGGGMQKDLNSSPLEAKRFGVGMWNSGYGLSG